MEKKTKETGLQIRANKAANKKKREELAQKKIAVQKAEAVVILSRKKFDRQKKRDHLTLKRYKIK